MRNLILSTALVIAPVAVFSLGYQSLIPSETVAAGLGDLTPYMAIVSDTQSIAKSGDLTQAEVRITDLETLWDKSQSVLYTADPAAWGTVDDAADAAFAALRAKTPDSAKVETALADLQAVLKAPMPTVAGSIQYVSGVAVTDESGHPLACEMMITDLRDLIGTATPLEAVKNLQDKALERCNADDDKRADDFAAQAISLLKA